MKFLLISLIILLGGCKQTNGKTSQEEIMKKEFSPIRNKEYSGENCRLITSFPESFQDSIITHYKLQKSIIVEEDNRNQYQLTDADIEIGGRLIYESLLKNGFKPIDQIEYKKKISDFFNIQTIDNDSYIVNEDNYFINLSNPFDEELDILLKAANDPIYQQLYFFKNYNIISCVPLIRDFIQNRNYEDEINDDTKICIPDVLIYRNKYIFNNSNASLIWLINNDIDFLERLVREFGYDKNNKINKAVLSKISREYNDFKKEKDSEKLLLNLFAKKNNRGNLEIREDLCKYISSGSNASCDYQFVRMMYDFASLALSKNYVIPNLDENEKLKIASYLGYYIQLYYDKYDEDISLNNIEGAYTGSFFRDNLAFTKENDLLKNIKANNYYNLPGFEPMVVSVLEQTEEESEEWLRSHPDK